MHFDWNAVITLLIAGATLVIRNSIKTPKDVDRAALLATLADDAAAVIVNLNPKAPWGQLVRDVISRLRGEATLPTENVGKLEAAAIGALTRLGHSNDEKKSHGK